MCLKCRMPMWWNQTRRIFSFFFFSGRFFVSLPVASDVSISPGHLSLTVFSRETACLSIDLSLGSCESSSSFSCFPIFFNLPTHTLFLKNTHKYSHTHTHTPPHAHTHTNTSAIAIPERSRLVWRWLGLCPWTQWHPRLELHYTTVASQAILQNMAPAQQYPYMLRTQIISLPFLRSTQQAAYSCGFASLV